MWLLNHSDALGSGRGRSTPTSVLRQRIVTLANNQFELVFDLYVLTGQIQASKDPVTLHLNAPECSRIYSVNKYKHR